MMKTIDEMTPVLREFPTAKHIALLPSIYTDLETGEIAIHHHQPSVRQRRPRTLSHPRG
jgi:hypothetical protein